MRVSFENYRTQFTKNKIKLTILSLCCATYFRQDQLTSL